MHGYITTYSGLASRLIMRTKPRQIPNYLYLPTYLTNLINCWAKSYLSILSSYLDSISSVCHSKNLLGSREPLSRTYARALVFIDNYHMQSRIWLSTAAGSPPSESETMLSLLFISSPYLVGCSCNS